MRAAELITSLEGSQRPKIQYVQSIKASSEALKESLKTYLEQNTAIVVKETQDGLELYEIVI